MKNFKSRRSFIFTPPLEPKMFDKALSSGSDIVCLELEDGISPKDKIAARQMAINIISEKQNIKSIEKIIRINSIREKFGLDDIRTILDSNIQPDGIMIPKVKSPEEIRILESLFEEKGHNTKFHIIIETNEGLKNVLDIAASSKRIEALFFGAVDMSAELRCKNNWNNLLFARSKVVHAAALNRIDVIDVPFLDLQDLDKMKIEAMKAKDLGFSGKGAVHPKQIKILNDVFTPTLEEVTKAKIIVDTFNNSSTGLVVYEGKLIEKPVLRDMLRTINIYDKINSN
ncbi:CoA ester lyase [Alphaproteobacteria bacterium]|nr:CoA ester lyase [Alphaproteobacteria bacterium]